MTKPGGILFLDLSTSVGFAYGHPGDAIPEWGVWKLPHGVEFGRIFNAFENELLDAIDRFQPVRIGVERPIPQSTNNVVTAEITYGLHAILALRCWQHEKPLSRPAVGTIRSKVMGRSSRTDEEKRLKVSVKDAIVKPWCALMGWHEIISDDARDAAAGWAYECGLRASRVTRRAA